MPRRDPTRRAVLAGAAAMATTSARAAVGPLETNKIRLGLPVPGSSFLPIYVAAEKTWKANGLDVEMASFRGDAEVAQALAAGSIDVSCQSLDGLLNLVAAEQPVIGFYAGFYQADFAWAAQPAIKSWKDLRGKLLGVSTFGSLTDELTRYVLVKNGLDPAKDVKIIQSGPSQGRLQALKSGRLDCSIMAPPDKWAAEDAGLHMLAEQVDEVAKEWPKHAFLASKAYIDARPNTLKTLLRAHVQAIRSARANPEETGKLLAKALKFPEKYADKAYREVVGGYNERGDLPLASMDVYWKIMIEGGTVKAAIPNDKLIDDRFIKTFDEWAP
jgi:ABC-type nitrate/sulfonate/bicarbonate transport system substrate-binding protein